MNSGRDHIRSMRLELAEAERVESALAIARVILAAASSVAIYLDPTEPEQYIRLTYALLAGYTLFSVGVLIFPALNSVYRMPPVVSQVIDVLWISIIIATTGGSGSPFFVFFTF